MTGYQEKILNEFMDKVRPIKEQFKTRNKTYSRQLIQIRLDCTFAMSTAIAQQLTIEDNQQKKKDVRDEQ